MAKKKEKKASASSPKSAAKSNSKSSGKASPAMKKASPKVAAKPQGKASKVQSKGAKPQPKGSKPQPKDAKSLAKATPPAAKSASGNKGKTSAKPAHAVPKQKAPGTAAVSGIAKAEKSGKKLEAPKPAKLEKAVEVLVKSEAPPEEVLLTDSEGRPYCKVSDCDDVATTDGYCRYHYLLNWKKIQLRKKILQDDKLDRYIEELTARYPDRFLEIVKRDLASEKDFLTAIQELDIDEGLDDGDYEDDSRTYIEEVRGTAATEEESDF